jgi:hypothetical protein
LQNAKEQAKHRQEDKSTYKVFGDMALSCHLNPSTHDLREAGNDGPGDGPANGDADDA